MRPSAGWTRVLTYLAAVLVVAIGAAGVVAGEADDSPGLQLLGAFLALGGVALALRTARARRRAPES
jgi:hypothetical protein